MPREVKNRAAFFIIGKFLHMIFVLIIKFVQNSIFGIDKFFQKDYNFDCLCG